MKLPQHLLLLLLLSCGTSMCFAQDTSKKASERPAREMIGTSLARNTCKPSVDEYDEKVHICNGVDDYSVLVKGDVAKPEIVLVAPDGTKYPIKYWDTTDPGFEELQSSILWIVVNQPAKTIAIVFRLKLQRKSGYSQWGHHDIIVRVTPGPVCIVGSLPGSPRNSSESMTIAGSPDTRPCIVPEEFEKP